MLNEVSIFKYQMRKLREIANKENKYTCVNIIWENIKLNLFKSFHDQMTFHP